MKSLIKTQRKKRNYTGWILLLGETTAGKTAGAQRSGIKYSSKSTSPLWKIEIISIMSSLCSREFSICISQLLSVQRTLSDSPCRLFFPPHTQNRLYSITCTTIQTISAQYEEMMLYAPLSSQTHKPFTADGCSTLSLVQAEVSSWLSAPWASL